MLAVQQVLHKSLDDKLSSLKKTISALIVVLDSIGPTTKIAVHHLRQTTRILDLAGWYKSTKLVFFPNTADRRVLTRAKNTFSYVSDSWANLKYLGELEILDMARLLRYGSVLAQKISIRYPPIACVVSLAIEPVMKGFTITANAVGVCEQLCVGKFDTWQKKVELAGRVVDLTANVALLCLFPQGSWIKKASTLLLWVRAVI